MPSRADSSPPDFPTRKDFDGDDAAALHANDDPAELELGGDAVIEGGALVLTAAEPGHHGALLLRPRNRGTRFFAARFSLMIGGGAGGDGASFCYGDLSFEPDEEDDEVTPLVQPRMAMLQIGWSGPEDESRAGFRQTCSAGRSREA